MTSSRSLLFFLTTLTDWVQWKKWNHNFEEFWLSLTTKEFLIWIGYFVLIIIIFVLTSVFHACMSWSVSYERRPNISVCTISLLAFLSFKFSRITSLQVFLGRPLGKLSLSLKFLYGLDQALSPILSRLPTHYSLLSFKDSLILSILL